MNDADPREITARIPGGRRHVVSTASSAPYYSLALFFEFLVHTGRNQPILKARPVVEPRARGAGRPDDFELPFSSRICFKRANGDRPLDSRACTFWKSSPMIRFVRGKTVWWIIEGGLVSQPDWIREDFTFRGRGLDRTGWIVVGVQWHMWSVIVVRSWSSVSVVARTIGFLSCAEEDPRNGRPRMKEGWTFGWKERALSNRSVHLFFHLFSIIALTKNPNLRLSESRIKFQYFILSILSCTW